MRASARLSISDTQMRMQLVCCNMHIRTAIRQADLVHMMHVTAPKHRVAHWAGSWYFHVAALMKICGISLTTPH